jgi:hypothetical protein
VYITISKKSPDAMLVGRVTTCDVVAVVLVPA